MVLGFLVAHGYRETFNENRPRNSVIVQIHHEVGSSKLIQIVYSPDGTYWKTK